MEKIRFFRRLAPLIISGRKTGTIRSRAESTFKSGQILPAVTHEEGEFICKLEIKSVEKVDLKNLNRCHAKAEGFRLLSF